MTPAQVRILTLPSGRRPIPAPFPGPTCASQLETVQRWYDTDQRDQQQVRAVGYGTRAASAIEQAVGARATDQDWEQRLTDALTAFRDCRWPLDYLRPAAY